jgi:hypothetical protein
MWVEVMVSWTALFEGAMEVAERGLFCAGSHASFLGFILAFLHL